MQPATDPSEMAMTTPLDLPALELKAWKSTHEDGFLDMFLGALLLVGCLRDVTGESAVTLLMLALPVLFMAAKHFITVPRIGLVKFGARREARRTVLILVIGASVLLMAALYLLLASGVITGSPARPGLLDVLVSAMLFVIFAAIGLLLDLPRMYAIAAVFAAANLARGYTDSPLVHLVAGLVVFLPGLFLCLRFLRRYPLPREEER
jgi:hypothetical protein